MKRKMKKVVGLGTTLALAFTLVACGNEAEINTAEHETYEKDLNRAEEITVPEETTETAESEAYQTDNSVTATNDEEERHKQLLIGSVDGMALVEFHRESKTYMIIPVDAGLIQTISEYAEYGLHYEEWNNVVSNLLLTSEMMMEDMGTGYSIKMINPADFSRTLINIKDGEVITRI